MAKLTAAEKRAKFAEYVAEGKTHISPTEAAPLLDCVPYSINLWAHDGTMPPGAYRFHGRNCRVNMHWLAEQIGIKGWSA